MSDLDLLSSMKKDFFWLALSILTALTVYSCGQSQKQQDAGPWEIINEKVPLADPFILLHDGVYYAYGTGEPGFRIYTSTDLEHWQKKGIALDIEKCWGTKQFWAPEVYYIKAKNKFFIFYSSEEHICVATSDSPEGPFTQEVMKPIREEKGIDTSLFIDDDGTPYLFFVRFTGGNVIWVAEMTDDLLGIKEETLTECISAVEPWELVDARVTEGPSVFKHEGLYYMIYSANHTRNQDYAVGYATSSSLFGPWEKFSGNPVLRRDFPNADGLVGTGHGAPFKDKKGNPMYVFHAHFNDSTMYPRTMYIDTELHIAKDGSLSMPGEVIRPVVVSVTGDVPEVPFTVARNYFFRNDASVPKNAKITDQAAFDRLFGAAAFMGKDGEPTRIDFGGQFVIAVVNPVTDVATELKPVSLSKENGELIFNYKETLGEKQTWSMQPVLLILVDREYEAASVKLVKQ